MPRPEIDVDNVRQLPLTHAAKIVDSYLDDNGHMNVMWYSELFGQGMRALFKKVGLVPDDGPGQHHRSFALEVHIRYLSEVRVGEEISIHSRLVGKSEKRFHTIHFMVNENKQDVAATFEAVGSYVDLRTRRTAPIPEPISSRFDVLIARHSSLGWDPPLCGVMSA